MTLTEAVQEYIDVLNSPPNGWGQHVGPKGRSDYHLYLIYKEFGKDLTDAELDRQFNKGPAS